MAFQQNGYAYVPCITYDVWRLYALLHGVNVDFAWGNQCWDICALLWYQYGLRLQTGNGYAWGCWTLMRYQNARSPFVLITDKNEIKRGDIVVFNRNTSYYSGHIAFADQNYTGGNKIRCLGQNQGQGTASGTPSNIKSLNANEILGAFRNTNWTPVVPPTPPTPTPTRSGKFPWVLYARKFRQSR